MKRFMVLFLMLVNLFTISGCGTLNLSINNLENKTLIEGQWKLERVNTTNITEEYENEIVDTIVSFSNEEVILLGKVYESVSYKAKIVNKDEYLYDFMGYLPDSTNIESEEITVVTISSNNTFIKDVMISEDGVYILEDGSLYELIQVDKNPLTQVNHSTTDKDDSYYKLDSGVLLGLRRRGEEGNEYRTLWISNEKGQLKIEELSFLLLPRKNGFFKVSNKREYNEQNYYKDVIVYEDMNGRILEFHNDINMDSVEDMNIDKAITFIGNDFMSTRTCRYNQDTKEEILSTYVLDLNTFSLNKPIPLGELTESDDINNVILSSDEIFKNNDIDTFTNFSIKRKQGRWSFYTLNPKNNKPVEDEAEEIRKFNSNNEKVDITLKVSEKIARHDEIFIPWQGIQKQVPSAVDAISSPNENLAVIKTKSKLYIYKIINNNLDKESEVVIPLNGRESIVMAEWAEGDYVGLWSEQVKDLKNK